MTRPFAGGRAPCTRMRVRPSYSCPVCGSSTLLPRMLHGQASVVFRLPPLPHAAAQVTTSQRRSSHLISTPAPPSRTLQLAEMTGAKVERLLALLKEQQQPPATENARPPLI